MAQIDGADITTRIVSACRRQDFPPAVRERLASALQRIRSESLLPSYRNMPDAAGGQRLAVVDRSVARLIDVASISWRAGNVLYQLIREFKPQQVVELGTCLGVSGSIMLAALAANGQGRLLTVEGSAELAQLARHQLDLFGPDRYEIMLGLFDDTVPRLAQAVERLDLAFVDDEHSAAGTYRNMRHIAPLLPEGGIIVFDDINWFAPAWRTICARPDCLYACQPSFRGSTRLGIWVKGAPARGYQGQPEVIELLSPYALGPVWRVLQRTRARVRRARVRQARAE